MKKSLLLIIITLLLSLSGCDRIRTKLGMPTSADLEIARMIRDSIEMAVIPVKTDPAVSDSIKAQPADTAITQKEIISQRYHLIAGSFKDHNNAAKLGEKLKSFGIEPVFLDLANGFRMVSAGGYPDIPKAKEALAKLLEDENSPGDLWVYDSKTK